MRPPIYLPQPEIVRVDGGSAAILLAFFLGAICLFPIFLLVFFTKGLIVKLNPKRKNDWNSNTIIQELQDDPAYRIYTR